MMTHGNRTIQVEKSDLIAKIDSIPAQTLEMAILGSLAYLQSIAASRANRNRSSSAANKLNQREQRKSHQGV